MSAAQRVVALVVTHNRLALLQGCLRALLAQTRRPDRILVIDNASTDGTQAWLDAPAGGPAGLLRHARMSSNLGGAGGFAAGMRIALGEAADWIWMMDDDAAPRPEALDRLLAAADDPGRIYGSLAVADDRTAWPVTLLGVPDRTVTLAGEVPGRAAVGFLPFLGILVHRAVTERIGFPAAGFFIAADDLEYSLRARRAGIELIVVGTSLIDHPAAALYALRLPGLTLSCRRLPPWKRYYDTRNKLLIARRYHGYRLWTETLPGSLLRLAATLVHEPQRLAQIRAFVAGSIDGLAGRQGRRHQLWRIGP